MTVKIIEDGVGREVEGDIYEDALVAITIMIAELNPGEKVMALCEEFLT